MTQTIEFLLMTASRSIGGEVVGLEDWNTGNPWKSTETGRSRLCLEKAIGPLGVRVGGQGAELQLWLPSPEKSNL